jgi:hypothetical protein
MEFIKYSSLISTPLFGTIALLIIRQLPEFSFKKHTISKSVYFIKHKTQLLIFRLNFFFKMTLDLFFSYYLINNFKISITSHLFWLIIIPPILFGTLSYFIMGEKYGLIHRILIFSYGILFGLSGVFLAYMTNNKVFLYITISLVIISNYLILEFFAKRKINVFVQVISMGLMYGWLLTYVFQYL